MDYTQRGEHFEHCNMIDYFVNSYEVDIDGRGQGTSSLSPLHNKRQRGRPFHLRVPYLAGHPKALTKQRIVRGTNHNNLPNFIGCYFPARDDADEYPLYCASMLMLLKPWRRLEKDLKQPTESWEGAFADFISRASTQTKQILSGIQYYHKCRASATWHSLSPEMAQALETVETAPDTMVDEEEGSQSLHTTVTEELLAELEASQPTTREEWHGLMAIEAAKVAKIFDGSEGEPRSTTNTEVSNTTTSTLEINDTLPLTSAEKIQQLLSWKQQMAEDVHRQNPGMDPAHSSYEDGASNGKVDVLMPPNRSHATESTVCYLGDEEGAEQSLSAVEPDCLHYDQFRAYDIITGHLESKLAGQNPPPLRMLIHGEPGTGKSKVIQTATQHFLHRGARFMLQKSTYTGIAASLIDGKTTHSIAMISQRKDRALSTERKTKLQTYWKHIQYLVIDEVSMISKSFLAKLSRNISIGKMEEGGVPSQHSFRGVSVILCGDFFQFPPVACAPSEALYFPTTTVHRNQEDSQLGRSIFEEFTTVVSLKEQMRVTDPVWQDFLHNLRLGNIQEHHLSILRTLVLMNNNCVTTNFNDPPWNEASLVTPRHAVRRLWNDTALHKHAKAAAQVVLECHAEDTIKGQPLTLTERYAALLRHQGTVSKQRKQDLPDIIQLTIGMKVMVTQNIETDLDITNGAWGTIVDIWLHTDKSPISRQEPLIKLKYLPVCILVKLDRTRATRLKDLEESVIPVEPTCQPYHINSRTAEGTFVTRTVRCRQFP